MVAIYFAPCGGVTLLPRVWQVFDSMAITRLSVDKCVKTLAVI
jgi:hypothetical protein